MKAIPLIRASQALNIARALDARGGPTDRLLERVGIPTGIREDPQCFLPGRCVWSFADEVSRTEQRDLLFHLADGDRWRKARWVRSLAAAVTLGEALQRMCASFPHEIPMIRMGLDQRGDTAWFWRRHATDVRGWPGTEPAEQYMLSLMLAPIRAAAGPRWRPTQLLVGTSRDGWASVNAALEGVRVRYGQPLLAVGIPVPMLALPVSIQPLRGSGPPGEPAGEDFATTMRQVLRTWLRDGGLPNQDILAEILGVSTRTLHRRLAREGVSWRSIANDLKFEAATTRLRESRLPAREVAEQLGFSDAAHFTRFFRSRAGFPPSVYRERVEHARELARASSP